MPDTIYIVTTFDYGCSSDVQIHVATEDLSVAEAVYETERVACARTNAKLHVSDRGSARMMVELTRIPKDTPLHGKEAANLYWRNEGTALKHNNSDDWEGA